jgi:hypothetical protein
MNRIDSTPTRFLEDVVVVAMYYLSESIFDHWDQLVQVFSPNNTVLGVHPGGELWVIGTGLLTLTSEPIASKDS